MRPHQNQLQKLWDEMLDLLPPPSKPLVKDHTRLIGIRGPIAVVEVRNKHLIPFAKKRQKDLESALSLVLGQEITVRFTIDPTDQPNNILKQRIKKEKGLELTDGQAIALQAILDFLKSHNRTFALSGYAGTGKTFLTQLILDECDRTKKDYLLTAPTNKAARVLAKTTGKDAITIARMLGLRPKIDKTTGKEIFARDPDAPIIKLDNYDLIILDEASMISAELLEMLSQEFTLFGPKFLFLGDTAQLPPVGETRSLAFDKVDEKANLTEVVRYDGAILNWATALRSSTAIAPPRFFADNETLITVSDRAFAEKVIEAFTSTDFTNNTDHCRVLAWTNASVKQWNKKIRKAIFGKKAPRFVAGERLVATGVCTQRQTDQTGKVTENIILPSSEEIEVVEAHPEKGTVEFGSFQADIFDYWVINAQDSEGTLRQFRILCDSDGDRVNALLRYYAQSKDWDNYWGLKRAFHPLHYAYALTVHRSQGSTFEKVFLDLRNLLLTFYFGIAVRLPFQDFGSDG